MLRVDLALVGLALGAEPVSAWNLLLSDYDFRDSDLVNNPRVNLTTPRLVSKP